MAPEKPNSKHHGSKPDSSRPSSSKAEDAKSEKHKTIPKQAPQKSVTTSQPPPPPNQPKPVSKDPPKPPKTSSQPPSKAQTTSQQTPDQLATASNPPVKQVKSTSKQLDKQSMSTLQESIKPSTTEVKEFRYIPKGAGGTLSIHAKEGIRPVGTFNCKESVGLHSRINAEQVFCAHLFVAEASGIEGEGIEIIPSPIPSEEQGKRLSASVCKKLKAHATEQKWKAEDPEFGRLFVIACQRPMKDPMGQVVNGVGWYLMNGVRDFLMEWVVLGLTTAYNRRPMLTVEKLTVHYPLWNKMSDEETETWELYHKMKSWATISLGLSSNDHVNGFVVDAGLKPDIMTCESAELHMINRKTKVADEIGYQPKKESIPGGQWRFSLKGTEATSGKR